MEGSKRPRRQAVTEAIKHAREFEDLAENFEYHAAKNEQGLLERRIHLLEERLQHAVTVRHETDEHIGVGSIVEIADEDGETMEVEISAVGGVAPGSRSGARSWARGSATSWTSRRRAARGRRACSPSGGRSARAVRRGSHARAGGALRGSPPALARARRASA